jgi:hypothetical protein
MQRHTGAMAAFLVIGLACAHGALAQDSKFTGTRNGTNTSSKDAGTGNAGDSTTEVGSKPTTPRHKRVRVHQAASTASGAR